MVESKNNKKSNTETPVVPEGFKDITNKGADCYFTPAPGMEITGIILHRDSRMNDDQGKIEYFYHIALTCDVKGKGHRKEGEDEAEVIDCTPGMVMHVDEKYRLRKMADNLDADDPVEVFIGVGQKRKTKGTKSMWEMSCAVRKASNKALERAGL